MYTRVIEDWHDIEKKAAGYDSRPFRKYKEYLCEYGGLYHNGAHASLEFLLEIAERKIIKDYGIQYDYVKNVWIEAYDTEEIEDYNFDKVLAQTELERNLFSILLDLLNKGCDTIAIHW